MSVDSFSEVSTQSWGSRIKGSLSGIFFGIIMIIASFVLLFWNEGRAVKRAQALDEGASSVVSITSNEINPTYEGKLVHLTGEIKTTDVLSDPVFGITKEAVKLRRSSDMYQWEEEQTTKTKEKVGGKKETVTTYSYKKTWSSSPINSQSFKRQEGHYNPGTFPYPGKSFAASNVKLNAFQMSDSQISSLSNYQTLTLSENMLAQLPEDLRLKLKVEGNNLYYGKDSSSPEIGDMRISFEWISPGDTVSVIAQQQGNSFVPYVAKSGSSIQLMVSGTQTAEAMFNAEKKSNTILTWILRAVGFFLMFLGFRTIMNIFRTLAAVIPFVANIVGFGLSLISAILAASFTLLTIAIAWFVYRPMLSIILIVVIVLILVAVKMLKKPSQQQPAFVPPPPPPA